MLRRGLWGAPEGGTLTTDLANHCDHRASGPPGLLGTAVSPGALCVNVTLVSWRKESPHAGSRSPEQVISLLHIGFLGRGAETLSVPGSS